MARRKQQNSAIFRILRSFYCDFTRDGIRLAGETCFVTPRLVMRSNRRNARRKEREREREREGGEGGREREARKAHDAKSFASIFAKEVRTGSREFTLGIRLRKILPRHQMHHRGFSEGKTKSTERDIAV